MTIIPAAMLLLVSCSKTGMLTQTGTAPGSKSNAANTNLSSVTTMSSTMRNTDTVGKRSQMPAFYDSAMLTIQFVEFAPVAEAQLITHNKSINFIYQSDPGLPNNVPFISVIDAIPHDSFNPLWREVQIAFNPGITPYQLFSDNEVLALAYGPNPQITLDTTNEVYWCPVVGHK